MLVLGTTRIVQNLKIHYSRFSCHRTTGQGEAPVHVLREHEEPCSVPRAGSEEPPYFVILEDGRATTGL